MSELLLPTAANARLLAKRPTTAVSTELNNCCKMLLAARGRAKISNLFHSVPWVISIVFFLLYFHSYKTFFLSCLLANTIIIPGKNKSQEPGRRVLTFLHNWVYNQQGDRERYIKIKVGYEKEKKNEEGSVFHSEQAAVIAVCINAAISADCSISVNFHS